MKKATHFYYVPYIEQQRNQESNRPRLHVPLQPPESERGLAEEPDDKDTDYDTSVNFTL